MIKKVDREYLNEVIDLVFQTTVLYNTSTQLKSNDESKKMFSLFFTEAFDDMEVFGYFKENKLVGVIGIENNNYIPILYVLDKYQKKGVGTELLKFIKKYIKNKTDKVELYAHPNAVSFYEKNGFKKNNDPRDKVSMFYNLSCIKKIKFSKMNEVIDFLWDFVKNKFKNDKEKFRSFIVKETLNGLDFYGYYDDNSLKGLIGIKENQIMFLHMSKEYQYQKIGIELLNYISECLESEKRK